MEQLFYTVAGHTFSVEIPRVLPVRHLMPAYQPFVEERLADPLFALHIELCNQLPLERAGSLLRRLDDDAAFIWVYRQEDAYAFGFSNHAEAPECLLFVDPSYRNGQLFVLDIRHRQQPDASLCLEYSPEEYAFDSCVGSPAGG